MEAFTRLRKLALGLPSRGMIAMFHVGRCGSTVLANAINQHSSVRWGGELFDEFTSRGPGFPPTPRWARAIIMFSIYRQRCEFFGFETKSVQLGSHCIPMTVREYVSFLQELGFSHFIVLTRSNLLRSVISSIVAGQSGKWHVASGPGGPTQVRVDPDRPWGSWAPSLTDILDEFQRYYTEFDVPLSDNNRLDLNYEVDIQHDLNVGYKKVCGFLGIEPEPFEVRLARTNPYSIEQMIVNYDEVSSALRGTQHEWMLRS